MKINKLVLQNFKKFSQKTIEFKNGFNVVIGENESGKSTIVDALLLILYANPSSKSKDLEKFYSWKSDKPFRLELEFEALGKKYYLIKDFFKREGVLKLPNGKEITNIDLIQDYLYSELKIPLQSVYLNSAFIKQDEIVKLNYKDGELKNSIQNMVVEGEDEVDIPNIKKELDKKISLLTKGIKGNSMNPGPIKALTEKVTKDEAEIRTIEDKWTLSLKSRETVESNNSEIKKLSEEIELNSSFFKKVNTLKELNKKSVEYNNRYDELAGIEEDYTANEKDIESINKTIKKDYEVFANEKDISRLEEEVNTLIAQEKVLSRIEPTIRIKSRVNTLNIALIVGVLAVGGFLSMILKDFIPFMISLIGLGLYLFIIKAQKTNSSALTESTQNEDLLSQETKKKLEMICQRFGLESAQKIITKISEFKELNSKIKELELKEKFILGKYTLENIVNEKRIALREIAKIDIQIKDGRLGDSLYSDEKLHQLEYNIGKAQTKLKTLERETMLSQAMLASSDISQESINIKKEQLEEDKSELEKDKNELIVFQMVKESILESYEETIKDSRVVIEDLINKNILKLTNGRYSQVKLSPELNLEVFSKEQGEYISYENLSKGTIDQIFLLARLGFTQGLLGNSKMPIILDDPFVNFDEKRLLNIKEILLRMCSDYQMILFTHNKNYANWGEPLNLE